MLEKLHKVVVPLERAGMDFWDIARECREEMEFLAGHGVAPDEGVDGGKEVDGEGDGNSDSDAASTVAVIGGWREKWRGRIEV